MWRVIKRRLLFLEFGIDSEGRSLGFAVPPRTRLYEIPSFKLGNVGRLFWVKPSQIEPICKGLVIPFKWSVHWSEDSNGSTRMVYPTTPVGTAHYPVEHRSKVEMKDKDQIWWRVK